jgi:hypothetical protein
MTDKKISQLTGATTPLAGTEVLPIVQSSTTVKVATDDLTVKNVRSNATSGILQVAGPAAAATRTMTVPDANFTAARTDAAQTFTGDQTFGTVLATTVDTNVAAAGVTLAGTTLAADGTDTNISVTVTPKGTGDLVLTTGNLKVANGAGIDFSATSGTGQSELLADYEHGVWTPELRFGGSSTGITYISGYQNGLYTKVGNLVTLTAALYVLSKGVQTGDATIVGIPFASANEDGAQTAASIYTTTISFADVMYMGMGINSTVFNLLESTNAGVASVITDADFSDFSYIHFTVSYRTA